MQITLNGDPHTVTDGATLAGRMPRRRYASAGSPLDGSIV